jgi:hypothetical protein
MLASPIVAALREWTFKAEALSLAASQIRSYSISPCLNLEEQPAGVCLDQDPDNSQFVKVVLPTSSGEEQILSRDFLEWFRGFTDGEGCFIIHHPAGKVNSFIFNFKIELHKDDVKVLYFIQSILRIGSVHTYRSAANFVVSTQDEIKVIVDIFSKFKLNSTKHLDFLAFRKGFLLYVKDNSHKARREIKAELIKTGSEINRKRTDYNMPEIHEYNITSNWLLGFTEADGSFYYDSSSGALSFAIEQKGNEALLKAIQDFLHNLVEDPAVGSKANQVGWVFVKPSKSGIFRLIVRRTDSLESVLIPLFDGLTWHSKKYLDYCDWKTILMIRKRGLHYLTEGETLIELILQQMNNNRLSTADKPGVDRAQLLLKIDELLSLPIDTNYEIIDGKTFIKSLNRFRIDQGSVAVELVEDSGNIIQSFNSYIDCAKFLGVTGTTISNRAKKGTQFKFKGKSAYIRKV